MRYFIILLFLYFSALTILPSVRALKLHFTENCQSSCQNENTENEPASGCQKEKCLLNFNFNTSVFLVFASTFELQKELFFNVEKANTHYHKNFISNFNVTIWQPPELFFIV